MDAVATALARLTDDELAALATTITAVAPGPSPSFLEWMGIQADREQHRRLGVELSDPPLDEALPMEETNIATAAAIALRDTSPGRVREVFAAVVGKLTAGARH